MAVSLYNHSEAVTNHPPLYEWTGGWGRAGREGDVWVSTDTWRKSREILRGG